MTHTRPILVLLAGLFVLGSQPLAEAGWPWGRNHASNQAAVQAWELPWHRGYAYQNYGTPVAQVVPPTANMQMNYSWGVPSSRMTPIYHQWNRVYPGGISGHPSTLGVTPDHPSDTSQFGVYYVRGPWGGPGTTVHHGSGWHLFRPDLGYGWHLGGLCGNCGGRAGTCGCGKLELGGYVGNPLGTHHRVYTRAKGHAAGHAHVDGECTDCQ